MPLDIPSYDDGNQNPEEDDFNRDSVLPELDGSNCEEANQLRALAASKSVSTCPLPIVDLGTMAALTHVAVWDTKKSKPPERLFVFQPLHFYRIFDKTPAQNPLPKQRLVRAVVKYFTHHDPPKAFLQLNADSTPEKGSITLMDNMLLTYVRLGDPFYND